MNFIASSARAAFIGLICLALQSSMLVHAKQQADVQANSNQSDVTSQTAKQIQQEKLQQELRNLLAENKRINHEKIHTRQQIELLILPFYLWYFTEYLFRLIQYRDRLKAYHNISFEREAYANEKDLSYLKSRSFWSFLKYIKR